MALSLSLSLCHCSQRYRVTFANVNTALIVENGQGKKGREEHLQFS
jgi:hypothetical protein